MNALRVLFFRARIGLGFHQAVKSDARLFFNALFLSRHDDLLDFVHHLRIQGSTDDSLLTIGSHHNGREYGDGFVVVQCIDDIFTDLSFGGLDRRDEMLKLSRIHALDDLGSFGRIGVFAFGWGRFAGHGFPLVDRDERDGQKSQAASFENEAGALPVGVTNTQESF